MTGGGPPVARPIVAVVDDDPHMRAALERLLRSIGYRVATFEGTAQLLAHRDPGALLCVLVDLQMPGIDGVALTATLTARYPSLPVLAMTAYPGEAVRRRAMDAGAVAFLAKPLDAALLEAHLALVARASG